MRWWTFNEATLERALTAWAERRRNEGEVMLLVEEGAVRDFLDSPEVRAHKMRGDG